jgi:hypothetical protein
MCFKLFEISRPECVIVRFEDFTVATVNDIDLDGDNVFPTSVGLSWKCTALKSRRMHFHVTVMFMFMKVIRIKQCLYFRNNCGFVNNLTAKAALP